MERKIPRAGRKRLIFGLLFAFGLSPYAHAGGGGLTGGALEVTQLMNNAELVAQVGEAVQTTANTLMTVRTTMQMLRNLPETLLSEVLGGLPIESVRALSDAYKVMSEAVDVYRDVENLFHDVKSGIDGLGELGFNVSPSDFLLLAAEAAYSYGGVYKQAYEQEVARVHRLIDVSKDVQKQIDVVKSIDSQVSGIQALASQNITLQSVLTEIAHAISSANQIAMREAEREKIAKGDRMKREANDLEELKRNREASLGFARSVKTDNMIKINM